MAKVKKSPQQRARSVGIFYSRKEREYLVENLSVLVGAGMGVVPALEAIREELKTRAVRRAIDDLRAEVDAGPNYFHRMPSH